MSNICNIQRKDDALVEVQADEAASGHWFERTSRVSGRSGGGPTERAYPSRLISLFHFRAVCCLTNTRCNVARASVDSPN